jgi:hypothetical protein
MSKYIWATIGGGPREMEQAFAVVVHAEFPDEARTKVIDHILETVDEDERGEVRSSLIEEYGSTWFVQRLSVSEIR